MFGGGGVAVLEDFRRLEMVRHGRKQIFRSRLRQDKGHRGEWEAFATAIRTGSGTPIPMDQIVGATLTTLRAADSSPSGLPAAVDAAAFIRANSHSPYSGE